MKRELTVAEGAAAVRLDTFLASELGISRSNAQALIKTGKATLNGGIERSSYLVRPGDRISAELIETRPRTVAAPDLPVVYEDDDILVVDKPAGIPAHPGSGTGDRPTVGDFARLHTSDSDPDRPGIIHRLDQDTSGLMILAKTAAAREAMQQEFRTHKVQKTYQALVVGRLEPAEAVIKLPLDRDPANPLRRAVVSGGREAVTPYRVLANYPGYCLVEARPRTGRTHQLRVHFAALGHPIAGDTVYGSPRRQLGLRRQFLHAAALSFTTPSGQALSLSAPLPNDLRAVLRTLEKTV